MKSLEDIRQSYANLGLEESKMASNPNDEFKIWFDENLKLNPNPGLATVFYLSTATPSAKPSTRSLLLKSFDENGFVFYTNYQSRKGLELAQNPQAAMLFDWPHLHRDIRIEGTVSKISREESIAYFHTRPRESQLGALASHQSHLIKDHGELEHAYEKLEKDFKDKEIPCPEEWGGYLLKPQTFEYWQGRPNRLHDRIQYQMENNTWVKKRLAP